MWECLVRSVKTCLRKVLGRSCLEQEELQTLICEVEAVINSLPLTYLHTVSSKPSPLTPAHFLTKESRLFLPTLLSTPVLIKRMPPSSTGDASTVGGRVIISGIIGERIVWWSFVLLIAWVTWTNLHHSRWEMLYCYMKINNQNTCGKWDRLRKHLWEEMGKIRSSAVRLPSLLVFRRPVQLLYPLEVDEH